MDKRYEKALERARAAIKDCGDNLGRKKMIYGIFPELQESEDEKMREIIMKFVWGYTNTPGSIINGDKSVLEYAKEVEAYLEKQKEQKPADDKAFEEWIEDWWKHNKVNNPDSYDKGDEIQFDERGFKNFCRGIRNMYQQKPAEWSEEDDKMIDRIMGAVTGYYTHRSTQDTDEMMDWLRDLRRNPNPLVRKPNYCYREVDETGWTEEYRKAYYDGWNNCDQQYSQLKLTRPAGWSDEDEKIFRSILANGALDDKQITWLKSIRPQPHWKPSEEQMSALFEAHKRMSADYHYPLITLYDQLKKL